MRKPPCKKNGVPCAKRCPGCQDHCPDYKEYRAELDADNKKKRQEKEIDSAVWDGKGRLLSESCLQLGGISRSRKMGAASRAGKRDKKHRKI